MKITDTSKFKSQTACVFVLILVSCLVYFNSLKGSFHYDDLNLIQKGWIADFQSFKQHVDITAFANRPILLFTFAVNNAWNKNQVFGFHLLNLHIHIFVSILIYSLLIKTQNFLEKPSRKQNPVNFANLFPFLGALVFALHPLNTDSVTYISSRSTTLSTFFYLLALTLFLEIFSGPRFTKRPWPKIAWILLTLGCVYFAVACKLTAITLPLILAVWFIAFICPRHYPHLLTPFQNPQRVFLFLAVGGLLLGFCIYWAPEVIHFPRDQGGELFGRIPYFLIQAKVVVYYYLKLFLVPVNLNIDNGFPFTPWGEDIQIPIAMAVLAGLAFLAFRQKNIWIRTGAAWFLITLLPTSSIIPLNDLAVEHRMYLPMSLGLCVISACILIRIPARLRVGLTVVIITFFGLLTLERNQVWVDDLRLWKDAVQKNPHSPRTHNNLAKAFYEAGNLEKALAHFLKSVESIPNFARIQYNLRDPRELARRQQRASGRGVTIDSGSEWKVYADFAEPHYNLASVYLDLGKAEEAQAEYRKAIDLNPGYFAAYLGLGSSLAYSGKLEKAIQSYRQAIAKRKAVTIHEDYPEARLNLGEVYGRMGRFDDAIRELRVAVKHDPSLALGHYNLGVAYMMAGDREQSRVAFETCLRLNDRFEPARFNLARLYQYRKDWDRSTQEFERFLSLKPNDPEAVYQIGWNYHQGRQSGKAREFYEKSIFLKPDFIKARIGLAKLFLGSRQFDLARVHLQRALELKPSGEEAGEIHQLLGEL